MIAAAEMDYMLILTPERELRETVRQMLRSNFRMAHYEKRGKVVEGFVPIVIDGKTGFIFPLNDTYWNFQNFMLFMNRVLTELEKCL